MFIGIGTVVNVSTILVGSTIGVLVGHRFPERTRTVVTDALGLVTLVIAGSSAIAVNDASLRAAVGDSAPMLIVLGALLIGGIGGSLLRLEERLEGVGGWLQRRLGGSGHHGTASRTRFIQGFVTASLIFCVGPLALLGSIDEGLGRGSDQLFLKSVLDGFASIAFAASFGWGVAAAALAVLTVQGAFTALGAVVGNVLPDAEVASMTATGGILLIGVALRLLNLKQIKVVDLLPALVVAPLLTAAIAATR